MTARIIEPGKTIRLEHGAKVTLGSVVAEITDTSNTLRQVPHLREPPYDAPTATTSSAPGEGSKSTNSSDDEPSYKLILGGKKAFLVISGGLLIVGMAWALISQRPIQQAKPLAQPPVQSEEPESKPQPQPPYPVPEQDPVETQPTFASGINQSEAKSLVERWLSVKQQIFAPPYNTNIADQLVAEGPLWTDLTKSDGSIEWLRNNNSYYTYSSARVNEVISFTPSETMPSITVSVTEDSVLHSPRGSEPSSDTNIWLYTFKKEGGSWKLWDYRKKY
jgi:hypothetical protein